MGPVPALRLSGPGPCRSLVSLVFGRGCAAKFKKGRGIYSGGLEIGVQMHCTAAYELRSRLFFYHLFEKNKLAL